MKPASDFFFILPKATSRVVLGFDVSGEERTHEDYNKHYQRDKAAHVPKSLVEV